MDAKNVGLIDGANRQLIVVLILSSEEYLRYLYRTAKPPISEEELARYRSQTEVGSLDDFWKPMGVR